MLAMDILIIICHRSRCAGMDMSLHLIHLGVVEGRMRTRGPVLVPERITTGSGDGMR